MMSLWLASCQVDGLGLPPMYAISYVDPDGETWSAATGFSNLSAHHVTGPDCEPGTWLEASSHDVARQFRGWFGYSTAAGNAESEEFYVQWGPDDDPTLTRWLFGGFGELVSRTDTVLEYRIDGAQDCTRPDGASEDVCTDQTAAASFLVEGEVARLVEQEAQGVAQGTDAAGDPVCGLDGAPY